MNRVVVNNLNVEGYSRYHCKVARDEAPTEVLTEARGFYHVVLY